MSIHFGLYDHPVVRAAIDEVFARWEAMPVYAGQEGMKAEMISGWNIASFINAFAPLVLERHGITDEDLALFDEIFDAPGGWDRWQDQATRGALYEQWDMERAKAQESEGA